MRGTPFGPPNFKESPASHTSLACLGTENFPLYVELETSSRNSVFEALFFKKNQQKVARNYRGSLHSWWLLANKPNQEKQANINSHRKTEDVSAFWPKEIREIQIKGFERLRLILLNSYGFSLPVYEENVSNKGPQHCVLGSHAEVLNTLSEYYVIFPGSQTKTIHLLPHIVFLRKIMEPSSGPIAERRKVPKLDGLVRIKTCRLWNEFRTRCIYILCYDLSFWWCFGMAKGWEEINVTEMKLWWFTW